MADKKAADSTKTQQLDGRRLRSERSKRAILDACIKLVNSGSLVPTAQSVSDEAGVPIRTLFRHFPDMEALFKSLEDELRELYRETLYAPVASGTLSERVEHAVELNAKAFEAFRGVTDSTKAQLWRYAILKENYARWQHDIRLDRLRRLPELKETDESVQELVDSIGSYEMWDRLRAHQQLGVRKSTSMVKDLMLTLIENGLKER